MNLRRILISVAALMGIAGLAAWWLHTYERVEEDVDAPLQGEARYNPYYALKKVLQARGLDVDSRASLDLHAMTLEPQDTLVLGSDVRTLTHAQATELVDWIDDGGQLIFALPPGGEGRGGDLLDGFGLHVKSAFHCIEWPSDTATTKGEACFNVRFTLDAESADSFDLLVGDAESGYVMGRQSYGDGGWFVAGDLDFLHNRALGKQGAAALAWQIVGPALHGGKVHLVYGADVPPLHVLLVKYGWPALLPALLALFAWLWMRSQRLGPLLPLAEANRRALQEHVQAAGEFMFRRGRAGALYAALRRALVERLRRNEPAIAALDGDALVDALAAHSKRSPAEIRMALNPIDLNRPEHFVSTVKILTELGTRT
jgi:hypothetical protein